MRDSALKLVTFLRVARQIIGIRGFEASIWARSSAYHPLQHSGPLRHAGGRKLQRGPGLSLVR